MPKRKSTGSSASKKTKKKEESVDQDGHGGECSNIKLLAILSPAKTLDLEPGLWKEENTPIVWTQPSCDVEKRRQVIDAMKQHANKQPHQHLGKLLGLSAKLTQVARSYWLAMGTTTSEFPKKPCGFAFDGVAYKGLDISNLSKDSVEYLQEHLRTVDPLYGWLKPMDVIEAYRLEMATRGVFDNGTKTKKTQGLAKFWKPAIRESIQQEEQELQPPNKIVIVNLASDEYSAAVDWPNQQMVKVIFRHAGRVLAVHAKRARGLMARYMAENNVTDLDGLTGFDLEGYSFQPDQSSLSLQFSETDGKGTSKTLVFDRPADWNKAKKAKTASTKK